MKKFLVILAISSVAFLGCCSKQKQPEPAYYDSNVTNTVMQSDFNEENYIWESFIFSTNRADKTK